MNKLKTLGLVFLIILPYLLLIFTFKSFTKHCYELELQLDSVMEDSYFLGCADAGHPDLHECRIAAKNLVIKYINQND